MAENNSEPSASLAECLLGMLQTPPNSQGLRAQPQLYSCSSATRRYPAHKLGFLPVYSADTTSNAYDVSDSAAVLDVPELISV